VTGAVKRAIPLLGTLLLAAAPGCRRGPDAETRKRTATVAEALRPAFLAGALRHLGGAHFQGTVRFVAGPQGAGAPEDAVTTTTDVWLDRQGNYRLREVNDRDGGREVVLTGRELAVALRYGKMIRRIAEEPEPTRLLEEALGGPWAAWELVAPAAAVARASTALVGGTKATEYSVTKAAAGRASRPAAGEGKRPFTGLRSWRGTVSVGSLAGNVVIDDATGAVLESDFSATLAMKQEGKPLQGSVEVHTLLTDVASTPPIERPPAEDLALRQRTVPEQRELLGGLPASRGEEAPGRPQRAKPGATRPRAAKPAAAKPRAAKPGAAAPKGAHK
jgi:hypothetical protein